MGRPSSIARWQKVAITIVAAALTACQSIHPKLARPNGELGRILREAQANPPPPEAGEWWQVFGDAQLNGLISRALQSNPEIAVAVARLDQAQATGRSVGSKRGLRSSGASGVQRVEVGDEVIDLSLPPGSYDLWALDTRASWELDFFGRLKRELDATEADASAASAATAGVRLMVAAEVCASYFEYLSQCHLSDLARTTAASQERTYHISGAKVQAGSGREAENARAEAAWRTTLAEIPAHEAAAEVERTQLALWCGTTLDQLPILALPTAPASPLPTIPTAIESLQLRRRPDVQQAEYRLSAAEARVDVAVKEFFPKIKLTGIGGWRGIDASTLLRSENSLSTIGPAIEWPIFQSGHLKANVASRSAEQREAVAEYEHVVLEAMAEVHGGLAIARAEKQRLEQLTQAHTAALHAAELSAASYREGATPLTESLDAERAAYALQKASIDSRLALRLAALKLLRATAGDF